jgi:hypothetical protein
MQRWKCAVGAIVLIAFAGGSVAACSKGGNAKQNAAQAKAKPKADPKAAAKADPKAAAPKTDPKAAKPAPTAANTPKAMATPAPKTAAPQAASATKPATPAPAPKTAQPPANTKATAPVNAAATKPATTPVPVPAKPAAAAPAPAKPTAAAPAAAKATTTPATAAAPAATTVAAGDVQQTLQTNKSLVALLQSRLPAGTDVVQASMGFRNLTQFVSAVHACQNLSIPFDKMRTAMVDEKKSLSAAIRALKPTATATIEAQRADYEARGTIYQAQHSNTPAADPSAKKTKPATTPGVGR